MRRRKVNFNNIGKVSCLLLLLLAFLSISPTTTFVSALEDEAREDEIANEEAVNIEGDEKDDDGIMELSDTNSSIVGISFSPAMYYASLSPTDAAGKTARIDLSATVNVYNSGGYAVYLKSNDTNLVGANNSSNVIPSMGAITATYNSIPVNTWGYAKAVDEEITSSTMYKVVAVSNDGDKLAENTNTKITSDSKTINLSFATKINNQKPADTYSNTMTLSVVSSPMQVTFAEQGITLMQAMTPDICNEAPVGDSIQLMDTRDGKYYWISKLADGKCWMTQNLALDLSTSLSTNKINTANRKTLTNADTDLNSKTSWTPTYPTFSTASGDTIIPNEGSDADASWNLGSYYIKEPGGGTSCGVGKSSLADCTEYFTQLDVPTSADGNTKAHYLTGNYYQWCTATAGCSRIENGTTLAGYHLTSGEAADSICPKGWKLPISNSTAAGSFGGLTDAYSIVNEDAAGMIALTSAPLYFVMDGYVIQDVDTLFALGGYGGYYWASTPTSDGMYAFLLYFGRVSGINPFSNGYRSYGFGVRCVAR